MKKKDRPYVPFMDEVNKRKKQHFTPPSSTVPQAGQVNFHYVHPVKNGNGRAFFTQYKMSRYRLHESILNSRRKRGLESRDIHPWDAAYI